MSTAAYALDAGHAVVPHVSRRVSRIDWRVLRSRPVKFTNAVAKGQALRDLLLSPDICDVLDRHADRRVLLIADQLASGLPWELLEVTGAARPSIAAGMVRCIKLAGAAPPPFAHRSTDGSLRVLLVVDPREDLRGAAREGDAVEASLAGRPDVIVERLEGRAATRERVRLALAKGDHDILHYAGHAFFDPSDHERSGLLLAGGETLTSADLAVSRVPRLVVLGACQSARLAEGFLRAGVTTMIGTFYEVSDAAALTFASRLHTALANGNSVGAAVLAARRQLHDDREEDWGTFLLYGNDAMIL